MSLLSSSILSAARLLERIQVNSATTRNVAKGRSEQRMEVALRYFTWRKFFNFWRIEFQLRGGVTKVNGRPYEWEIDTTNVCQLKCPLCHTGLDNVRRDKGFMHFDTFTKVIDQIKDHCIWLSFYSWGEPFLTKEIDRYVAYAHRARIATIISTNLNKPLTPEMAERVIKSGLDVLICSIDGATQDVYEIYRVGGRLDRVMANLKLLIQKKRELGSKTPYIEWQFIVMRQNQHQIPEADAMAKEIGVDGIVFKKVDFPLGEENTDVARRWLPVGIEEFERKHPFERPYGEHGARCWRLWRSGVINWDGGYAPCCFLTDKQDDFGNVNEHSIKAIWNNEHYRSAREMFAVDGKPTVRVGCVTCPVYTGTEAARRRGDQLPPASANGHAKPVEIPLVTMKGERVSSR